MPIDSSGSRSSLSLVLAAALVPFVLAGGTAAADEETPPARAQKGAEPARHGSAFVDPVGFLLFGPRVGVEIGGGRLSGALYGRWFNPGLLAHSLFLSDGDDFGFSYGAGLRGRYYGSEGVEGAHVGFAVEYLRTRIETPAVLVATVSGYAVPSGEAGYRLTVGSFYADASAALGYAFKLSGSVENLPGGNAAGSYQAQDKSSIYGSASLDLGVYF